MTWRRPGSTLAFERLTARRLPRGSSTWCGMKKENLVSINTPPVGTAPGDFASGERTEAQTAGEVQASSLQGDFAAGEQTVPETSEEILEAGLHGDFAAGERTEPLTAAEEVPGNFSDTDV